MEESLSFGYGGATATGINQAELAQQYKSELLARMFGWRARAASTRGEGVARPRSLLASVPPDSTVLGVGFGVRGTEAPAGGGEGEKAVLVYVRSKLPRSRLDAIDIVPPHINGLPTDVIELGRVRGASASGPLPIKCGVSCAHEHANAGTLGCLVKRPGSDELFILSNNHVLANHDNALPGDPIVLPGRFGDTFPGPVEIARLEEFEYLMDGRVPKRIDAAIAKVVQSDHVEPDILEIGTVQGPPVAAADRQRVCKRGFRTGFTNGVVMDANATIDIEYDVNGTTVEIEFDRLMRVSGGFSPFSEEGDSGALILEEGSLRPVGLLCATTPTVGGETFANPIELVLQRFGVEIV